MPNTTFEEAKRCPKCNMPGDDRSSNPVQGNGLRPGTTVHMIYCVNTECKWYNTCWAVQVNPDGSIPPAQNHTGKPKVYQNFDNPDEIERRVLDNLQRQYEAEQRPGAEVRNPRA